MTKKIHHSEKYLKELERCRIKAIKYYYANLEKCRERSREYSRKNRIKSRAASKTWREGLKLKVINHYSSGKLKCACCGEKEYMFLTVDHINNDGSKQRKMYSGGGHHNYRFIMKNGYPLGYQILCYNCNCGRARMKDKICPHQKNVKKVLN